KLRAWPKDPRVMSGMLKRLAPNLRRAAGIDVVHGLREPYGDRSRLIRIERLGKSASGSVRAPAAGAPPGAGAAQAGPASVRAKPLYGQGAYGEAAASADDPDDEPRGRSEHDHADSEEGEWTG